MAQPQLKKCGRIYADHKKGNANAVKQHDQRQTFQKCDETYR